ncbi:MULTISPECIES: PhoH family protein [Prochlorococcus]|uniref:PhoH-like protein n=1 Tax=Prochlorococcus marinus (strain SARG / CCMP1375 / SS120) TaxID=167539 RepID=Q7VAU6_PROMA|nr:MULTISPECIES: PhoH family protein [Prochlorococcus]AAQ00402.1 Phosphate starvation-inducible protein PhoH [Prochlorococcus marinus subsp. marinus str. CCMP1375]KGG14283.1 Phosphate starvation-inducible protein PhoH [Prochlorococcus marinus str. LG]KGG22144.1 Phosphate starvation-inducible protein PhoH [Prochlorococcus marinus str. SS2]KGG24538.1 Phosphate starvation-inducible protein PhoH [Prochlorococcus marinus str. SS35]KGG33433.1 Phosphate starvation-inducible protein PhoH [Prochlorococ
MAEAESSGRFSIDLPDSDAAIAIAGAGQSTLHKLEDLTGASIVLRGLQLEITGRSSQIERAAALVELIRPVWEEGQIVSLADLTAALTSIDKGKEVDHASLADKVLAKSQRGHLLRPRTLRQKAYVDAMEKNDLTFSLGPAGTGKTFLATVLAVRMLTERKIEKIILTRPAVEAGERLGFLPGDLQQKVDPYLRPLYDALHALLGLEKTSILFDKGVIEVAPLAYMRGRTLEDAFIILDEAQNTTSAQMRMVLTRLGERSRMVVTGDITQIDLPKGQISGLVEAIEVLKNIQGIAICHLSSADIVRHPLVHKVVDAYAQKEKG